MKIKLKPKIDVTQNLRENFKNLNFSFGGIFQKENDVDIVFYSQYQIERLLNISKLKNYKISTFVENHQVEEENVHKICFLFTVNKDDLDYLNIKLDDYLKPKNKN